LFTTPFIEWTAYTTGVIDAQGNIIVPAEKRSIAQNESFTKFDLLILKLKKFLETLPFGKTRLASFAAALYLIKEENNINEKTIEKSFIEYLNNDRWKEFDEYKELNEKWSDKYKRNIDCDNPKGFSQRAHCQGKQKNEDAPANSAGSGAIAGLDDNPPMGKTAQAAFIRRFANNDVFVVDTQRFNQARLGKKKYLKYEKYVGNDDVGNAIREYGRKYPNRPIIVQDNQTQAMMFLRYGRAGMFTESFAPNVISEEITQSDLKNLNNTQINYLR
jgi:hypothetical protein